MSHPHAHDGTGRETKKEKKKDARAPEGRAPALRAVPDLATDDEPRCARCRDLADPPPCEDCADLAAAHRREATR